MQLGDQHFIHPVPIHINDLELQSILHEAIPRGGDGFYAAGNLCGDGCAAERTDEEAHEGNPHLNRRENQGGLFRKLQRNPRAYITFFRPLVQKGSLR